EPASWRASRQAVVEACADHDETIFSDYVEGRPIDAERIHRALRRATLAGDIVPVFAGAALLNRGVSWLLDGVCRYLPSPLDRPIQALEGDVPATDADAP